MCSNAEYEHRQDRNRQALRNVQKESLALQKMPYFYNVGTSKKDIFNICCKTKMRPRTTRCCNRYIYFDRDAAYTHSDISPEPARARPHTRTTPHAHELARAVRPHKPPRAV